MSCTHSTGAIVDDKATIHRLRGLVRRISANAGSDPGPVKLIYMDDKPSLLADVGGKTKVDSLVHRTESKKKENLTLATSNDSPTPLKTMNTLPEGSVWCSGTSNEDRTCRFKNLCYNPTHEEWFIIKTNRSIQEGVPTVNRYQSPLLFLSSITNHPFFAWNYVEASPYIPEFQNISIRYEEVPHFLFKRLHPDNIMHNLHDDVLNLYFQIKKYLSKSFSGLESDLPFSLHTQRLLILDQYESTGATKPFQYLSNYPIRFGSYLTQKGTSQAITCFSDAFLGNSHITRWYQYGFFDEPQGPITPLPNGVHVREVAEWLIKRIGASLLGDDEIDSPTQLEIDPLKPKSSDNSHLDFAETNLIVVMARKWNRLILNEKELATHLSKKFGYQTEFLHNENQSFEDQIKLLRRARIVLAMHGSILIMGIFCRRGTVIIEMFPYAVPPENYTPYKTMSHLSGMDLVYRSWVNKYPENSVGHPEEHELRGGLQNLSPEMKELVLNTTTVPRHKCCTSPFWLYRIYQDTKIHLDEVTELIREALVESRTRVLPNLYHPKVNDLLFGPVKNIKCLKNEPEEPGTLQAYWPKPWTGSFHQVKFWELLVNNNGLIYKTKNSECSIRVPGFVPGTKLTIFVRPIGKDGTIGDWGDRGLCQV